MGIRIGEKIGIVGRNGAGKSSFLRLIMGEEDPSGGGSIQAANMDETAYFNQHQADVLPPEDTAWDCIVFSNEIGREEQELKELAKKFRFSRKLDQKVKYMSGGEKGRLCIIRMMLSKSSVLILDEPTNHLDVDMKETLEFAIRNYEGTVITVSHDRWFLSQTCKRIIAIEDKTLKDYQGDFKYYMDRNPKLRKKVEKHYLDHREAIDEVPLTLKEQQALERKANAMTNVHYSNRKRVFAKAKKEARLKRMGLKAYF